MKKLLIIGTVLAAVGLVAAACETPATDSTQATPDSYDALEMSAADVIDFTEATNPGHVRTFCESYVGIGDYDLALVAYKANIGEGGGTQDGVDMPTSNEMFDETLSRC